MSEAPARYGFNDPRYGRFPPVVQVALVSGVCPSKCLYCPMGQKNMGELAPERAAELPPAFFPFGLWRKAADETAAHPWAILRIHSRGEPMAHPDYVRMIAYAKDRGVGAVASFTNGVFLGRHVDGILDARLDLLEISADAADEERYVAWRRNGHFADVVEAVRRLFAARSARPQSKLKVVISAVDHPDFRPHRRTFEAFWRPMCDKVIVRPFHTYAGRISDPYAGERKDEAHVPCVQLWERFSISPAGLVNACFNDWGDRETVGDLARPGATIAGIWRGEKFEAVRAATLRGPHLECCHKCSGPSLSSWGKAGYQHWVHELLESPRKA